MVVFHGALRTVKGGWAGFRCADGVRGLKLKEKHK